jgi:hypothetical protein
MDRRIAGDLLEWGFDWVVNVFADIRSFSSISSCFLSLLLRACAGCFVVDNPHRLETIPG